MKFTEALICWNPNNRYSLRPEGERGAIAVVPWPDRAGRSERYSSTSGACFMAVHEMKPRERLIFMLAEFHKIVVRDGIDPQKAHKAFLAIDEYRHIIAPDCLGAAA